MRLSNPSLGGFLLRTLVLSVAALLSARLLPGVTFSSGWAAVGTAIVIALLDNYIRPILLIIALPLTVLSMGLFIFVVNAIIILMASGLVRGFEVDGLGTAILMSLIITAINYGIEWVRRRSEREPYREHAIDDDEHFDDYEEIN
ncbi:MAG: phage holin family protein [Bacteroidales bacterium]|nr:phage holin family protein [Bacteroidales bacterium]